MAVLRILLMCIIANFSIIVDINSCIVRTYYYLITSITTRDKCCPSTNTTLYHLIELEY